MNFRKYSKCRRKLRIYIRVIKNTFHYVFHILVLYTKLPIYAYLNSLICSAAFFESRLMTAVYTENTILGLYSTRVSSIVIDCGPDATIIHESNSAIFELPHVTDNHMRRINAETGQTT